MKLHTDSLVCCGVKLYTDSLVCCGMKLHTDSLVCCGVKPAKKEELENGRESIKDS